MRRASIGSTIETAADGSKSFVAVLHLDLKKMTFREAFGIRNQSLVLYADRLAGKFRHRIGIHHQSCTIAAVYL